MKQVISPDSTWPPGWPTAIPLSSARQRRIRCRVRSEALQRPPERHRPQPRPPSVGELVDLNTADQAALEALPGVGPVMASNILGWRQTNGAFTSVEQLQEVTGIGPARFAQLAPLVTV